MNIKLNNNEYSIPDSKLATATGSFISHLGTVAGSGVKVVVGGVEYGVDASKVAGAIGEIEGVLGELNNPSEPDNVAVLDEATLDYVVLA